MHNIVLPSTRNIIIIDRSLLYQHGIVLFEVIALLQEQMYSVLLSIYTGHRPITSDYHVAGMTLSIELLVLVIAIKAYNVL